LSSAGISLFSLGWNIWSKFIYPKPSVRVSVLFTLVDEAQKAIHGFTSQRALEERRARVALIKPAIRLEAVNSGPGDIRLDNAVITTGGYLHSRKHGYHLMSAYSNYPNDLDQGTWGTASMAGLIKPGEKVELYFPAALELFDAVKAKKFGFSDTFSRTHFCTRRQMRRLEIVARAYFAKVQA
jgi:hypothetical protein